MEQNMEQINFMFNDRAKTVFFRLYEEFKNAIAAVDRQGQEDTFQKLQTQYVNTLRVQLESVALDVLQRNERHPQRTQLQRAFTSGINTYIAEFIQKIRCL
jgi:hypothetical protein